MASGIFRYGKLISKEGSGNQKEKKQKKSAKSFGSFADKKETGGKISSKKLNKEKHSDKNIIDSAKNKNIAPLNNKNKVANPMSYKFGFLEKIKKSKK
jgi:hypothetical protein